MPIAEFANASNGVVGKRKVSKINRVAKRIMRGVIARPEWQARPVVEVSESIFRGHINWAVSDNGRFLRHRPERSEQRLNYERFYQSQPTSPNMEGVPKALA